MFHSGFQSGFGRWVVVLVTVATLALIGADPPSARAEQVHPTFEETLEALSRYGDRSLGTDGLHRAADYILRRFERLDFEESDTQKFRTPTVTHDPAHIRIGDGPQRTIHPFRYNAMAPEAIPEPGLSGPLIWVQEGEREQLSGKNMDGAIVLMELVGSVKNWQNPASLGAEAVIFLDRGQTDKTSFEVKHELNPIQFPAFWITADQANQWFGDFESAENGIVADQVTLVSPARWEEVEAENVYTLIEGTHEELSDELIIVEAFYDSTALVPGRSPGAGEAVGAATLIQLAEYFKKHPPARSFLLVATSGHSQGLAGTREMVWALIERSREMRLIKKEIKDLVDLSETNLKTLRTFPLDQVGQKDPDGKLKDAVGERLKTEIDVISRRLMRLRLQEKEEEQQLIQDLAAERLMLNQLNWKQKLNGLNSAQADAVRRLMPKAEKDYQKMMLDMRRQLRALDSALDLRRVVGARKIAAVFSMHLSSHGDGVGAFADGWMYDLNPDINRVPVYTRINDELMDAARTAEDSLGIEETFQETLRPSRLRPWRSYFLDNPPLGGEISALGGLLGVSLATIHDARPAWSTPHDTLDRVDLDFAVRQSRLLQKMFLNLARADQLDTDRYPRIGYSSVTGRANFIRHGELFADQPAPGTILMCYQGPGVYYTMVDSVGKFRLKGVADKKHTVHKVVIEGYKYDPETGRAIWAIDKNETGLDAYRVKMQRRSMETDLIMFACRGMTLFNLLEPRSFRYMTRINILDARLEAEPRRFWYSRIDTRSSVLTTVYLEPGTRLKMTLSDTVLRKKMVLINSTPQYPQGIGYSVDERAALYNTQLHVARDMWALLAPRITKLENKGIHNEKLLELQEEGLAALEKAETLLAEHQYGGSAEAAARSWALASRVYEDVEHTQKDVLFGVLFYIALFVPFAFCLERLLFAFTNIHKRIIAFSAILLALIAVIYQVHPAFQLAYSPTVVILAFFIMGLSLIVTLIIFFRFEEEMARLQRRASQVMAPEISRWQAFVAAFFLGVSNLKRRRLRTALTCTTLIILTFTIMSFTSVSSLRHRSRIKYLDNSPYTGFMLKNVAWRDLPTEALGVISSAFKDKGVAAPRVWLDHEDRTRPVHIPIHYDDKRYVAQGIIGLSSQEGAISGVDDILTGGRWFESDDQRTIIIPRRMADTFGIDPDNPRGTVDLWGMRFNVIGVFSGSKMEAWTDLDGETITPVVFPGEKAVGYTEAEMEALESGEEFMAFQSRYQHINSDLTVIVPAKTLMAMGGGLKSVVVRPLEGAPLQKTAEDLVDRFKLTIFIGEDDGIYMYQASDTLSYSGVPNIVIPILISVFIVLNTMIGSVYERKREIAIYTSIGLAPSHVSFLFIAESMAFAVLSVVLGYLFAQGTAALFAGTALWSGITVNYSSLAGVAAMLLVFLVVLISVIYPSKVAAHIAIPDVNRSWTLPDADGSELEVTLPILLKYHEVRGVGGYIHNYFLGHQDVSHGLFSTGDLRIVYECPNYERDVEAHSEMTCALQGCENEVCLHFECKVWLAPFDFGIMQHVDVLFCPAAEDPGFLEIQLKLRREAGEAGAWHRINKSFINQIRKQLLVWRSLSAEARKEYREALDRALGDQDACAD